MAFYPIDHIEPKNKCTECGKLWDGNPYDYETDDHKFLCLECFAKLEASTPALPATASRRATN